MALAIGALTFVAMNAKVLFILPASAVVITVSLFLYSYGSDGNIKGSKYVDLRPVNFFGIILLWACGISPLVSLAFESYVVLPPRVIDFEKWTVYTSYIYAICTILLMLGFIIGSSAYQTMTSKQITNLNSYEDSDEGNLGKIKLISLGGMAFSAAFQIYIILRFGGLYSFMATWTADRSLFDGLGFYFLLAEMFPIFFLFYCAASPKILNTLKNKYIYVFVFLFIYLLINLIFGGFRGSRGNTVWSLLWFAGFIHIFIKPIKLKGLVISLVLLIMFMQSYALYKSFGVSAFTSQVTLEETQRFGEQNPIVATMLGDFSRVTVHSYLFHEYAHRSDYEIKLGSTYVHASQLIIPYSLRPFDVATKNAAGAELFYGYSSISNEDGRAINSRIFGLFGESLLNFGLIGVLISSLLFGLLLAIVARLKVRGRLDKLIIPFISILVVLLFLSDLDNALYFAIRALPAIIAVYFGSKITLGGYSR